MSKILATWAPFALASLLTVIAVRTAWALSGYLTLLSCLGLLSLFFGIRVLRHTGLKLWPIVIVVCGLLVGQWWFLEMTVVMVGWKVNGFAP
jgi:uncharacterized membrane protein YqgA involved in biofilm formation